MEIEKSPQDQVAKKLRKMVKIMLKSLSKSKLILDMNMLLSQASLARKAISSNYLAAALTCRANDVHHLSFISPREYEFSCSNTPVYSSYFRPRRKNHDDRIPLHHMRSREKMIDAAVLHRMIEASPLRCSPTVTDRPPVKEAGEKHQHQIDRDAEAFIKKFYKDLKNQKRVLALLESPSPHHACAGQKR